MGAWVLLGGLAAFVPSAPARAQDHVVTLDQAIDVALSTHPEVRRSGAARRHAHATAREAESALWPRLDLSLELHRATGNVVPGTQLPLAGVPAVAGPPSGTQFDSGAWGTGIGATSSYDFAAIPRRERERDAAIAHAESLDELADATELDLTHEVALRYLQVVGAVSQRAAVEAARERAMALVTVTEALLAQELDAGDAAARAHAELATATTLAARAHQLELESLAALHSAMGDPSLDAQVDVALLDRASELASEAHEEHVLERARQAELDAARLTREARGFAYLPQVQAMAALWARGSGLASPARASDLGDAAGLLPNVPNWSLGIVLSYAVFDLPALDARRDEADAAISEAEAALDAQRLELRAAEAHADARLAGAREVAQVAPDAVEAARTLLTIARARYDAGLVTILDVVDAQRGLAQAELELVAARVAVLQAAFDLAYARGDVAALRGGAR